MLSSRIRLGDIVKFNITRVTPDLRETNQQLSRIATALEILLHEMYGHHFPSINPTSPPTGTSVSYANADEQYVKEVMRAEGLLPPEEGEEEDWPKFTVPPE